MVDFGPWCVVDFEFRCVWCMVDFELIYVLCYYLNSPLQ